MRKVALSAMIILGTFGTAHAADPLGEWLVEDKVATIKIVDCNSRIWGVIASEKGPPGVDSNNPDKTKKTRPTLGMPVLLNMKPDAEEKNKWDGHIYNAKNGKTYEASIELTSATQLKVEGCVLGFLCGGQTWTRVPDTAAVAGQPGAKPPGTMAPVTSPGQKTATPAPGAPKALPPGQKGAMAPATTATATTPSPASDVCMLPEIAGATH